MADPREPRRRATRAKESDVAPASHTPTEPTVVVARELEAGAVAREPAETPLPLPPHVPSSARPPRPGTPIDVQRVTSTMPRIVRPDSSRHMAAAKRTGGMWLVVLAYLLSATALGVSIYVRFVA